MTPSQHTLGELWKKFAPLLVGAGALLVGNASGLDLPPWATDSLKQWGPGATFFVFLVVWYVPRDFLERQLTSQQEQAVGLQRVADEMHVMNGQSGKLDEILAKVDNVQFASDIFGNRLARIEERLIDAQRQSDV